MTLCLSPRLGFALQDGGPEGLTVMVDYYTEDGSANAGSDYVPVKGTLTFYPDDKFQKISIEIVDDDVFEEDEHFYLHLRNLRVRTKDGLILDPSRIGGLPVAQLEMPATATIMILDTRAARSLYVYWLPRDGGPEGLTVMVDYYTEDGSANAGSDYVPVKGTLTFYPDDKFQKISIEIVDDDVFEEDEHFYLHLRNLRVRTKDGLILDPSRIGGLPVAQTYDGTAIGDKHYETKEGEVVFDDNQTE
ncbi:Calx-beta domain protein [Oesophagostomum dentatum]|uniref:Calx-beta domain protein n=1 Tax=Oesophagostomum dentatum TaxID=61180 RepID=A0A0B1SI11_OESDE|nr:Calx-beta domain protein [Oesophagostomum dentatum]